LKWAAWKETSHNINNIVRGARLCPACFILIEFEKLGCKNGECKACSKWFCINCLEITQYYDHTKCCILCKRKQNHGEHVCLDVGQQIIQINQINKDLDAI